MASVFIKTFGCSLNQADSEAMAGILEQLGHTICPNAEQAEVVIINSCTVKHLAEKKLYQAIHAYKDKRIVIAGCVPQAEPSLAEGKLALYTIVGTQQLAQVGRAVQDALEGKATHRLAQDPGQPRLALPVRRLHSTIAILPINEGCMSNCTYCKTKYARGNNHSYDPAAIKQHMEQAVQDGCKEIWLTSQDTGCYGLDIGTDLPALLEQLLTVRGDYRIRLGMMNPTYAHLFLDRLLTVFKHPKMYRFLHIPVQSGNEHVLRAMGRGYTTARFMRIVEAFRKALPDITISTDIIVGFPGETDAAFQDTYDLIKELRPEVLNISRFWLRPGTKAEQMEQVHGNVSKQRSTRLSRLFNTIATERNAAWQGWEGEALVQEVTAPDNSIARNDSYKQIILREQLEPGSRILTRIKKTTRYDLRGELLGEEKA